MYIKCPLGTMYCAKQCEQWNGEFNKVSAFIQPTPGVDKPKITQSRKRRRKRNRKRADYQTFNKMSTSSVFF